MKYKFLLILALFFARILIINAQETNKVLKLLPEGTVLLRNLYKKSQPSTWIRGTQSTPSKLKNLLTIFMFLSAILTW